MSDEANKLINDLFERLKTAEQHAGTRDQIAEDLINSHLVQHPSAPYYMAQTIIMQEAALKRLNSQVEELEKKLAKGEGSGSFLSGLFGTHSQTKISSDTKPSTNWGDPKVGGSSPETANDYAKQGRSFQGSQLYSNSRGNSFLGGALQTAAGVAGGMVVGNMLMNMFGHHSDTEIVNEINEQPASMDSGANMADVDNTGGFGNAGFDQNSYFAQADFDQSHSDYSGFGNAGFEQTDLDQHSFDSDNYSNGFADTGSGFGDTAGVFDDMDSGFDDFGGDFDI